MRLIVLSCLLVALFRVSDIRADDCLASEVSFWQRKADQGYALAQVGLGYRYGTGQGVAQDYQQAVVWFRKAAEQGFASGQFNLGLMYARGRGVPQDHVLAHKFYNLVAARQTGEAQERAARARDELAQKMTAQQIAEAQRLATEWKPKKE